MAASPLKRSGSFLVEGKWLLKALKVAKSRVLKGPVEGTAREGPEGDFKELRTILNP